MGGTNSPWFVTTHYMEEAERCHQLAFLSLGRRVAYGSPDQIRAMLSGHRVYAFESGHVPELMAGLERMDHVSVVNRFGNTVRLVGDAALDVDELAGFLGAWPQVTRGLAAVEPTLEDVFIAQTRNAG